jgi:hypothetical protein
MDIFNVTLHIINQKKKKIMFWQSSFIQHAFVYIAQLWQCVGLLTKSIAI